MSFSNVNIGTTAGDHSGDPLRTAFNKINQNFSQISLTGSNLVAGVYSVNNRNGNVVLTVNDIPGAVTAGNVSTIVQSNLTNYATLSALANTIPNVTAIGTQITTAIATEDLPTIRSQVTALQASIYYRDVDVDALQLGNILLTSKIDAGNAASISANAAMKSYVDYQNTVVTSAWTANAAAQAASIATLTANAATQTGQITSVNNDIAALTSLVYTYPTISTDSANAVITTANTAMKGYVDTQLSTLTNGASAALDTLLEIGSALGNNANFSGVMVTWLGNLESKITGSNAAIVTANTALKSYTDTQITTTQSWVTGANAAIVTANTALKSYVDTQDSAITTAWTANAGTQASSIATLTANAGAQSDAIALKAPIAGPSFTGNVGISGNIVGGNISTGGAITTSANITGNYFLGNGALLTGVITSATSINSGTSNVSVISSGGPVTIGVGGTSNVAVFASTGLTVTGVINSTGNVTGGNVIVNGSGTPTVSSATNLDLSAASAVRVIGGGSFRLPTLTTLQIANLTAANGDMVYNSTTSKIQAYANSAWGNIALS
jgi:hypothetical protein